MTEGKTFTVTEQLNSEEDWDALQEVTAELEQVEARIEELEAKLSKSEALLAKAFADLYRLHLRRVQAWDHAGTKEVMDSACAIIAELPKERSDEKGQDDE